MDHGDPLEPLSQYANRNLGFGVGITGKCAACHTNDGYIDWKENGVTPIGDPLYAGTQTITCTKYFIPGIIILDVISAITGQSFFSPSNTAYMAHVGGAVIGFLIMWYWKKNSMDKYRWN